MAGKSSDNGNGRFTRWVMGIIGSLAVAAILGAVGSYRALGQVETRQEDTDKLSSLQHQLLRDAAFAHSQLAAHPKAQEQIHKIQIQAAQTNFMVSELYRRATGRNPPQQAEFDGS